MTTRGFKTEEDEEEVKKKKRGLVLKKDSDRWLKLSEAKKVEEERELVALPKPKEEKRGDIIVSRGDLIIPKNQLSTVVLSSKKSKKRTSEIESAVERRRYALYNEEMSSWQFPKEEVPARVRSIPFPKKGFVIDLALDLANASKIIKLAGAGHAYGLK